MQDKIDSILGDIDGLTVDETIKYFTNLKNRPDLGKYVKMYIDVDYGQDASVEIWGDRPETADEMQRRVDREQKTAQERDER